MTADQFTSEMLAVLRREFFASAIDEKEFFQEKDLLLQAIAYPARYLNDRGAVALPSKYRAILRTVVGTIKAKGNRRQIRRFSVYFLHCVQEHMKHHGDDYYQDAKSARPVASLLEPALRRLQASEATRTTAALSEAHRALSSRAGRRKTSPPKQPELFPLQSLIRGRRDHGCGAGVVSGPINRCELS